MLITISCPWLLRSILLMVIIRRKGCFQNRYWRKDSDEVQETLLQNTVALHIEYFTLKESENGSNRKVSLTFPLPFSLKPVIDPHVSGTLPTSGGKEHPYSQRQRDTENNSNKLALLFPLIYYTHSIPFHLSYFSMTIHSSSSLSWKYLGLIISSSLCSLMKASVSRKTYIK